MSVKSVWLAGFLVLGACAANAQTFWSADPNLACGAYGDATGKPLQLTSGPGTGGYVCWVYGTLPWYDSGAGWASSIRVSAPASAPVAYFLNFVDATGTDSKLDFIYQGDPKTYSDISASQALFANQPLEVQLLGLNSLAPNYGTDATGAVTVLVYCPDASTCAQAQAQLIYSALPFQPWSLSVPVIWDWQTSYSWSAVGVDDSKTNTNKSTVNVMSFVIYNLDTVGQIAHTYTLNVYDSTGTQVGSATTRSVPAFGSYADEVANLFPTLPAGSFKLQLVSPATNAYVAFQALQFHGPSATTLVSASEVAPAAAAAAAPNSTVRTVRRASPSAMQLASPLHIAR